jgi:hypothetical protein
VLGVVLAPCLIMQGKRCWERCLGLALFCRLKVLGVVFAPQFSMRGERCLERCLRLV